jgi:hypothetical protein
MKPGRRTAGTGRRKNRRPVFLYIPLFLSLRTAMCYHHIRQASAFTGAFAGQDGFRKDDF